MTREQSRTDDPPKQARCPICGKPAAIETRPFCSRRCRDVDFARWMGGTYVISGGKAGAEDRDSERAAGEETHSHDDFDDDGPK